MHFEFLWILFLCHLHHNPDAIRFLSKSSNSSTLCACTLTKHVSSSVHDKTQLPFHLAAGFSCRLASCDAPENFVCSDCPIGIWVQMHDSGSVSPPGGWHFILQQTRLQKELKRCFFFFFQGCLCFLMLPWQPWSQSQGPMRRWMFCCQILFVFLAFP